MKPDITPCPIPPRIVKSTEFRRGLITLKWRDFSAWFKPLTLRCAALYDTVASDGADRQYASDFINGKTHKALYEPIRGKSK